MSFTSYTWVAHEETKEALRAAETYLAVAVIGGLVMLMGLFLLYGELGTLEFYPACASGGEEPFKWETGDMYGIFTASVCLLFGFRGKSRCIPSAHLAAQGPSRSAGTGICPSFRHTYPKPVFLVFLSSAALFCLLMRRGADVLLVLGVLTMVYRCAPCPYSP